MLVNMNTYLKSAKELGYAIPQFNINNLEWTRFILEACEEKNSPVILGVSESAIKYMGGYNIVSHIVSDLIEYLNITIPVVLHLDHGKSYLSCKEAIDAGFTSVMIDASKLPIEENIIETKKVVEYARKHNVSVEGEIGYIGTSNTSITMPSVEQVIMYVNETNVDAVAPALGSIHGIYKEEANLNFDMMNYLKNKINTPLVLHGGSGISDEKIKKAIKSGISKLNINTDLQVAWTNAVKTFLSSNDVYDPRVIIKSGEQAIKEVVYKKIELFESSNKK